MAIIGNIPYFQTNPGVYDFRLLSIAILVCPKGNGKEKAAHLEFAATGERASLHQCPNNPGVDGGQLLNVRWSEIVWHWECIAQKLPMRCWVKTPHHCWYCDLAGRHRRSARLIQRQPADPDLEGIGILRGAEAWQAAVQQTSWMFLIW